MQHVPVKHRLRALLCSCLLSAIPFVIVSLLRVDFLSLNRMLFAYATAILARYAFSLMLTRPQQARTTTAIYLLFIGAIICAGLVSWRTEHWALCGCGHPIDELIPARFYFRPMLSTLLVIATSYTCACSAIRGKYQRIANASFYLACTLMAWFALDLADV